MSFLQNVNKYGPVSCNELYNTNAAVMNLQIISLAAAVLVCPLGVLDALALRVLEQSTTKPPKPQSKANFYCSLQGLPCTFSPQWDSSPALCETQPAGLGWIPNGPHGRKKDKHPCRRCSPQILTAASALPPPNRNTQRTQRCGGCTYNLIKQLQQRPCTPSIARRRNPRYQASRRHGLYKSAARDSNP
jgi:hypothetical protein